MAGNKRPWYRKVFEPIDLMSLPFALKFNGNRTPETLTGALLSVIVIGIILAYLIIKMVNYLNYEIVSISALKKNTLNRNANEKFNLFDFKMLPKVKVGAYTPDVDYNYDQDDTSKKFIAPRLEIVREEYNQKTHKTTVTSTFGWYVDCPNDDSGYLCPPPALKNDAALSPQRSNVKTKVKLSILPCFDRTDCVDQTTLDSTTIELLYDSLDMDVDDFSNPIKTGTSQTRYASIKTSTRYEQLVTLEINEVYNKMGFPRKDVTAGKLLFKTNQIDSVLTRNSATDITCDTTRFNAETCEAYHVFTYELSNYFMLYDRNYKTLLQVVAEVGGLYSIVFLVFSAIYLIFDLVRVEDFLVEKVYRMRKVP